MTNQPPTSKSASPFAWTEQPSAEGWAGMEPSPEQRAELEQANADAVQAQYENDKMIFDVLTTGRGPEFLKWLETITIRQPSFVASLQEVAPGNVSILPAEQQGFFREGQNSMFRYFEAAIDRAKAGPPVAIASTTETKGN